MDLTDLFASDSRTLPRCDTHGSRRAACAMQRISLAAIATCASILAWPESGAAAEPEAPPPANAASAIEIPEVFGPALLFRPLDTLRVTGGFGEIRSSRFHAGYDFSTGERVGRPVRAPVAGSVERVRASGVGYGRSLYLRSTDGRLLVFGHLDAFAPAIAAHVDSAQRSAGRYEQDLWPAPGRFRFAAGDTVAWSGESGAGAPHLHFEVRHGDFAMHPLRGGLVLGPVGAPRLTTLTLEPLDADSRVAGGITPRKISLHATGDTLEVEGRVRAVIRSVSGLEGAEDAPAWSTELAWDGESVEARLDSISWAGEMTELDLLVDRGRIAGGGGLVMWAPADFRPRFLRTSVPAGRAAGVIEVKRGDPPRVLRLSAREPGGAPVERAVVLRPPAGPGPAEARSRPKGATKASTARTEPSWNFSVLPGPLLRVRVTGTPAGLEGVRIGRKLDVGPGSVAHWDGAAWVAIVRGDGLSDPLGLRIGARDAMGAAWSREAKFSLWPAGSAAAFSPAPGVTIAIGPGDVFEPGIVVTRVLARASARPQGLVGAGPGVQVLPEDLPMRRTLRVVLPMAKGDSDAKLAVYRRRGNGSWEWMGARYDDSTRTLAAESGQTGVFAVMRDTLAPRVRVLAPPRAASKGPYSRWQIVAPVVERGSGLDGAASAFVVDGVRVPTEWDPEEKQLRWRPLSPPAKGKHSYVVRAVDRAGNATTRRGTFVLDSAPH